LSNMCAWAAGVAHRFELHAGAAAGEAKEPRNLQKIPRKEPYSRAAFCCSN